MKKVSFNYDWNYKQGASDMMSLFGRGRQESIPVTLPHDAMISAERDGSNVAGSSIAYFKADNYEYSKTFSAPADWEGNAVFIQFEGAYMNAEVQVNGDFVGRCPYGYSEFLVRIDDHLKYGQDNRISVQIKNAAQLNSRWYTGAGIYRNTWLMVGEPLHILSDGVRVTTRDADSRVAALELEADIANDGIGSRNGYIVNVVKDLTGAVVSETSTRFTIKSNERLTIRQNVYLENPKLWNVENPNLYSLGTSVKIGEDITDTAETSFGIRKLQLDNIRGLQINDNTIKLKGGCVHHDNGLLGAATFEDAEERRVLMLKNAGYNAIRSAHNPISRAFLDACDRHGMLVMDEFSDMWTTGKNPFDYSIFLPEWWEHDIESIVRKDYNHPSVIMYSIGNEIPDAGSAHGVSWGRKFAEKFRSLDKTRYVTNGLNIMLSNMTRIQEISAAIGQSGVKGGEINTMMTDFSAIMPLLNTHPIARKAVEEACDMLDVIGYNYSAANYEMDHSDFPNRIVVGSETNPADLDKNWALVEKHGFVLGDFSWTSWDYLGEAGIGRIVPNENGTEGFGAKYPCIAAYCADFDLTGFRRPVSYWRETVWGGRKHMTYIAVWNPENIGKKMFVTGWSFTDSVNSWTWPGQEGKSTIAEIYSDADEVELIANGVSMGRKPVGDESRQFYCKWDVTYQPGELVAVSYVNDQEVGRYTLKTAEKPSLCVVAEKNILRSGINDLGYVNIELRDVNGTLYMADDRLISVTIEGPAILQGCGSANPCTEERYGDSVHMTYQGRMQAILRIGSEKGSIKVIAASEGMETACVELEVQ